MDVKTKKIFKEYLQRKARFVGRLTKLIAKYMDEELEKMWRENGYNDIRILHLPVLVNVHPDGINVNALAEKARSSKQAISQILKELEEFGYVEMSTDPDDKRVKIVTFSEKGIGFISQMLGCAKELEKRFMKMLGKEKLHQLIELQYELVCNLYPNYDENIKK